MKQVARIAGLDEKVVKNIIQSWVFLTNSFYAKAPPKAIFPCIPGGHTDNSLIKLKNKSTYYIGKKHREHQTLDKNSLEMNSKDNPKIYFKGCVRNIFASLCCMSKREQE